MKIGVSIQIQSNEVFEKRGISRQGKPYCIREQIGYVNTGRLYPVEVREPLDDASEAYAPGHYMVDPS